MSAQIIDGKAIAAKMREEIRTEVQELKRPPGLAVILVGEDPASTVYVGSKIKACEKVGIKSFERRLPENIAQAELQREIELLNSDPAVDGILLQLPLPAHLDRNAAIFNISPEKDVDGLHPLNVGRLTAGRRSGFVSCTPLGALKLIHSVKKDLQGLHAVVIGTSLLFGRPMAQLLLQEDCTVTMAHKYTRGLPEICKSADIIAVAAGKEGLVRGDWIKPGAIVIDVGINRREDGSLCGDVAYEEAVAVAGAITPVPGGVGPMTIACLLANTLKAAKKV